MKWSTITGRLKIKSTDVPLHAQSIPYAEHVVFDSVDLGNWYPPVMLGPGTIGTLAISSVCLRQVVQIIKRLEPDDYVRYLLTYYQVGLERFGDAWRYADITTVLFAAAQLIRPQHYLEIGVRRGRSMAIVAAQFPECHLVGFDSWESNYANMPNPGPYFVQDQMKKVGHKGVLEMVSGNSHETTPKFFKEHQDAFFDLITVDGDHTSRGAQQDLCDVLPRLKLGGVVVFDDICHPKHPDLAYVWQRTVASDPRFATWQFTELGYGVALAIRREV